MSRVRRITEMPKKPKPKKDREWFERTVSEIGKALEQLPEDRRKQFALEVLKDSE